MFLLVRQTGDTIVVSFKGAGSFDESTINHWRDELAKIADEHHGLNMMLDLADFDLMSSHVLGIVMTLHQKFRQTGKRFSLTNLNPELREALEISKFDKIVPIDSPPGSDDDENSGGVPARLTPSDPTGSGTISLQPPPSESVD